jgi:hypothetical protein
MRRLGGLREEDGIALVMALLVMMVLTISLTSVLLLTSAGSRHSSRVNAGEAAYALAEAGVNNAVSVLEANYPGTLAYPGDSTLLPSRSVVMGTGSCTTPVNNCVTWSGTLTGPLTGSVWKYEWRITSIGAVANPTGPGGTPVQRTVTAIVPVVIPTQSPENPGGPLNFLYAGSDMWFQNSVHVKAQVYVTNDLHLESTAVIDGSAQKVAVGHDLYLKNPQNQIGLTGGTDPRISEIHVVHQCSSKSNPTLHTCGPTTALWDADKVFATTHDGTIPAGFLTYTPSLTCCAPEGGTIAPSGTSPSNMGFWYQFADLGPLSPCDPGTKTGTPPTFDTAGGVADSSINLSATPTTAINLTPAASYTCKAIAGTTTLAELSWNVSTCVLTIKGTIFIDGSIYVAPTCGGGTARYSGVATVVASGTFGMKNSNICATHPGYTGACDYSATTPWDPNQAALVIVADGAAGGCCAQGQGSDFNTGEGIEIKNANFQGALIANNAVRAETTSKVQGPMISVYNAVFAGESNDIIFPPILFAPSGGGGIINDPPKPQLLPPQNFAGG